MKNDSLTETLKQSIKEVKHGGNLVHLATCSIDGKPNLVPMRFARMHDEETLVIADMYFCKTKVNIKENSSVAISVCYPKRKEYPYIIYGDGYYAEKGTKGEGKKIWDSWKNWGAKSLPTEVPKKFRPPNPNCRGILFIKVKKVVKSNFDEFGKEIR